jgi:hypothetical protein
VRNKTDYGIFVANYGVVPAGQEATVQESDGVKQLIKDGTLSEVKSSSSGGGSSSATNREGDA